MMWIVGFWASFSLNSKIIVEVLLEAESGVFFRRLAWFLEVTARSTKK